MTGIDECLKVINDAIAIERSGRDFHCEIFDGDKWVEVGINDAPHIDESTMIRLIPENPMM